MNTSDKIPNGNLAIYKKYMELVYYTNEISKKYPKSEKFAIVSEIKQTLYSGLRNLVFAIKSFNKYDKLKYLRDLDMNLILLKIHIRLSYKYQYITPKNYESWSKIVADICNMLGGWIISCQKR